MNAETQPRQPSGQPAGGQFAPGARPENGVGLVGDTRQETLLGLVEDAFPAKEDAGQPWVTDRVKAQRAARAVLPAMPDHDFFDVHWFGIESAAMQVQRFADDADGEEAANAAPGDTLGVDLGVFAVDCEPDRPGENGYTGYDSVGYAQAIAEEWRHEVRARIGRAVDAETVQALAAHRSAAA
jgi:hypothetical protein